MPLSGTKKVTVSRVTGKYSEVKGEVIEQVLRAELMVLGAEFGPGGLTLSGTITGGGGIGLEGILYPAVVYVELRWPPANEVSVSVGNNEAVGKEHPKSRGRSLAVRAGKLLAREFVKKVLAEPR